MQALGYGAETLVSAPRPLYCRHIPKRGGVRIWAAFAAFEFTTNGMHNFYIATI